MPPPQPTHVTDTADVVMGWFLAIIASFVGLNIVVYSLGAAGYWDCCERHYAAFKADRANQTGPVEALCRVLLIVLYIYGGILIVVGTITVVVVGIPLLMALGPFYGLWLLGCWALRHLRSAPIKEQNPEADIPLADTAMSDTMSDTTEGGPDAPTVCLYGKH